MTGVLVIGSAVLASGGMFALWDWACRRVVSRQERQLEADLRSGRW